MKIAILETISTRHGGSYHIAQQDGLEALRCQTLETNPECAEQACIYYADAIDILSQFEAFEPDPEEIAPLLAAHEVGNWRQVLVVAAQLTLAAYLDNQAEDDIANLNAAIQEAWDADYEVTAIHDACIHGWAPTFHEASWHTGIFHEWQRLDGDHDAYLLAVSLSDGGLAWLELVSVARQTRPA